MVLKPSPPPKDIFAVFCNFCSEYPCDSFCWLGRPFSLLVSEQVSVYSIYTQLASCCFHVVMPSGNDCDILNSGCVIQSNFFHALCTRG